MNFAQIAAELGISERMVYLIYERAMKKLAKRAGHLRGLARELGDVRESRVNKFI